jgi:hypothetical protein
MEPIANRYQQDKDGKQYNPQRDQSGLFHLRAEATISLD